MSAYQFEAEIRRQADGQILTRRAIPESCLEQGRSQVAFQAQRRGRLVDGWEPAFIRVEPVFDGQAVDEVTAVNLHVDPVAESDLPISQTFSKQLFENFVMRCVAELTQSQPEITGDQFLYRVYARRQQPDQAAADVRWKIRPLPWQSQAIQPLRDQAEPVGPLNEHDYPVFVEQAVLESAHQLSWKGRTAEGGAWLVGNLFRDTAEPHDLFAVIHTVLEARGMKHDRFSLDFSSETFADADAQLAIRRQRLGCSDELKLGFHHSHPFLPSILDGKEACPGCPLRPECQLTSSFFSLKDQQFHQAVFGRAGYAVQMVLGLTPREEFDLKMFCPDGGKFRERGYFRLPSSDRHELTGPQTATLETADTSVQAR